MKCLCCFLDLSISGPLNVQYELASKDLLRHFVVDLKCLKQFECLRSYYFMLDGEYNRNMTEGIFQKMYKAGDAKDLLNVRTMKSIIYSALDACATSRTDTQRVSFRIKPLPRVLDLSDINILECISLSYEVKWPLNVLLPKDVLAKYDDIFKFLLKVNRVSWVLKQMFMDLKMLHKNRGLYLTTSPQYQKVHLCRHVMTHFLQTLQNYIIGEVLENSWLEFHEVLETVESLEELNCAHSDYLKKIYFLCLLNEKSAPVRKVVMDMLLVILKFYDYLRSRRWVFDEDEYVHPNYVKLMEVFCNFMQLGKYFYKLGRKVAHAAYQPQFAHLMDILDMNYYYTYLNEKVY